MIDHFAIEAVSLFAPVAGEGLVDLWIVDEGKATVGSWTPGNVWLDTKCLVHLEAFILLKLILCEETFQIRNGYIFFACG